MSTRRPVYKVLPRNDWEAAQLSGTYAGSHDDARDGFIHLSSRTQLAGTLRKHFHGRSDLVLVEFEATDLGLELKWEASRGGELFPHLYAELPTRLARSVRPLHTGADGVPEPPGDFPQ